MLPRYKLLRPLPSAHPGETAYEATQAILGRGVELRFASPQTMKQLSRLSEVTHPALLTILDVGDTEGRPYYTTELRRYRTLAQILASEPETISVAQVLNWIIPIVESVCELHSHGLFHHDICLDSIRICCRSKRAYLATLGSCGKAVSSNETLRGAWLARAAQGDLDLLFGVLRACLSVPDWDWMMGQKAALSAQDLLELLEEARKRNRVRDLTHSFEVSCPEISTRPRRPAPPALPGPVQTAWLGRVCLALMVLLLGVLLWTQLLSPESRERESASTLIRSKRQALLPSPSSWTGRILKVSQDGRHLLLSQGAARIIVVSPRTNSRKGDYRVGGIALVSGHQTRTLRGMLLVEATEVQCLHSRSRDVAL